MFKKLRWKIVLIEISAFLVVAILIIGTININSYRQMIDGANETLKTIAANDGQLPQFHPDKNNTQSSNLFDGGFGFHNTAETQFTTRFFYAVVDSNGNIVSSDLTHIASVSDENIEYYVSQSFSEESTEGSVDNYRFLKENNEDSTAIYFLDCYITSQYVKSVFSVSVIIGLVCMAFVTLFVYIFSGIIIRPMEKNYRKQKRFITDAGHELKTPITAISANVDVLSMTTGENETTDRIKRQLQNLSGLVGELLTLSKIDADEAIGEKIDDVHLSELVNAQAPTFEIPAQEQGKGFSLSVHPGITVRAVEKDMKQLYSVLMDNAVKYCTVGGQIAVSLQKSGRCVKLLVINTSPPISDDDIDHLFDRFYRSDTSRSRDTGGYGIGLSIAKAITDKYKGKIRVYCTDGNVCFETVLPTD